MVPRCVPFELLVSRAPLGHARHKREPLINSYWSAGSRRVVGAVAMSSIFLLRSRTRTQRTRTRVPRPADDRDREQEAQKERRASDGERTLCGPIALDFTGRRMSSLSAFNWSRPCRRPSNCHCILTFDVPLLARRARTSRFLKIPRSLRSPADVSLPFDLSPRGRACVLDADAE